MSYIPPLSSNIQGNLSATVPTDPDNINADLGFSGTEEEVFSYFEQIYKSGTPLVVFFEQLYSILGYPVSYIEQKYNTVVSSYFSQYYENNIVISSYLDQAYYDSPLINSFFSQKYNDLLIVTGTFSQNYVIFGTVNSDFSQLYYTGNGEIISEFSQLYDIMNTDLLEVYFDQRYSSISGDTIITPVDINMEINGIDIPIRSLSVQASMSSYIISSTVSLLKEDDFLSHEYNEDVILNVNGTAIHQFIDNKQSSEKNGSISNSLSLVSPTARLDFPYSESVTETIDSGMYIKEIVEYFASKGGISVDWNLLDYSMVTPSELNWYVPGGTFSANSESLISIIKNLVNSVKGIVQTKPDGTMLIISKYPIPVPDWASSVPVKSYSIDNDIISISDSLDIRNGFNAFYLSDKSSSDISISLEVVDVSPGIKTLRGFIVPWTDEPFDVYTSGGSSVFVTRNNGYTVLPIPEYIDEDSEEWEVVEFIDWKGATSYPPYQILDFDWIEDDLGTVVIEDDGSLSVSDPDTVPPESLLRIKYNTRFFTWDITGPFNKPIQFYVPEMEE